MEWSPLNVHETRVDRRDSRVAAHRICRQKARLHSSYGGVPERGMLLVIDELKKLAKVEREIPPNEVEDRSILKEAQREMGIK